MKKILFLFLFPIFLYVQTSGEITINNGLSAFYKKNYFVANQIFNDYINTKDNYSFWAHYYAGLSLYQLGYLKEARERWGNIIRLGLDKDNEARNKINQLSSLAIQIPPFIPNSYIKNLDTSFSDNLNYTGVISDLSIFENQLFFVNYKNGNFYSSKLNGESLTVINNNLINYINIIRSPWSFLINEGNYIVSDFGNDNIVIFNKEFDASIPLVQRGKNAGEVLGPKGISLDQQGNIYLTDSGNSRVQIINNEGEFLFQFGEFGSEAGQFKKPSNVFYHKEKNRIYVLDTGNKRVQEFTAQGEFIKEWGSEYLEEPNDFFIEGEKMFILDRQEIYYHNLNNQTTFPLLQEENRERDFFLAMAYDKKNNQFYVSNLKNNQIEIFSNISDRYQNFKLLLSDVVLDDFPNVTIGVKVDNHYNHKVDFLTQNNFRVYENGVRVFQKLVQKPDAARLVFLVENSALSQTRKKRTENFLNDFFSLNQQNHLMKVISFGVGDNNFFQEKTHFNNLPSYTKAKILEQEKHSALQIAPALDKTINTLLTYPDKKAIIILAYQNYPLRVFQDGTTFERLRYYAKNNHIPIYIFYLGNNELELNANHLLAKLTETTGGNFYFYKNRKELEQFQKDFKKNQDNLYYLKYRTAENPNRRGVLRRVKVEVDFLEKKGVEDLIIYPIP